MDNLRFDNGSWAVDGTIILLGVTSFAVGMVAGVAPVAFTVREALDNRINSGMANRLIVFVHHLVHFCEEARDSDFLYRIGYSRRLYPTRPMGPDPIIVVVVVVIRVRIKPIVL